MLRDYSTNLELDSFFRSVSQDDYDMTDGNVESSTGWFGLLRVDSVFRTRSNTAYEDAELPANLEDGLYLVRINSSGTVWAYSSETEQQTLNEYATMSREYAGEIPEDVTPNGKKRTLLDRNAEVKIPDPDLTGEYLYKGDPEDAFMSLEVGVYIGTWEFLHELKIIPERIVLTVTEDESFAVTTEVGS